MPPCIRAARRGKAPVEARERFARLARQVASAAGEADPHRAGFGTNSLFVGRRMYARLDGSGALVLKLPPARVAELIARGVGHGWHPGRGPPLKEYVAVPLARQRAWRSLAGESRAYLATKAPPSPAGAPRPSPKTSK